jgi:hypothetical protein
MLAVVCALLLFAQQVGLWHSVWHAANPHAAQQVAAPASGDSKSLPHASKLCALDAALGQILGGGAVSGFTFALTDAKHHALDGERSLPASLHALTARSRGPPAVS